MADGHPSGVKVVLEKRFEVGVGGGARAAAEEVQAERAVLGEGVAGKMGLREQRDTGDAARIGELVPVGFAEGMEVEGGDEAVNRFCRLGRSAKADLSHPWASMIHSTPVMG